MEVSFPATDFLPIPAPEVQASAEERLAALEEQVARCLRAIARINEELLR